MTRAILPARGITAVAAALSMAACTSLSGLGGSAEYGCKAPPGVQCDSVSGNYYNALRNNLPSQRQHRQPASADSAVAPARQSAAMQSSAMPLRSQSRVLRLWVKPWEDTDHDLVDQGFVYVQIDNGRWLIDHVQQRIRSAYAPIRPPHAAAQPADTTAGLAGPRRTDANGAAPFSGTASPRPGSANPATGDNQ